MKLVRDCIPEIIESDGKWCLTRTVHGPDEHMVFLKAKMEEDGSMPQLRRQMRHDAVRDHLLSKAKIEDAKETKEKPKKEKKKK